jgi:hypothetical protein
VYFLPVSVVAGPRSSLRCVSFWPSAGWWDWSRAGRVTSPWDSCSAPDRSTEPTDPLPTPPLDFNLSRSAMRIQQANATTDGSATRCVSHKFSGDDSFLLVWSPTDRRTWDCQEGIGYPAACGILAGGRVARRRRGAATDCAGNGSAWSRCGLYAGQTRPRPSQALSSRRRASSGITGTGRSDAMGGFMRAMGLVRWPRECCPSVMRCSGRRPESEVTSVSAGQGWCGGPART